MVLNHFNFFFTAENILTKFNVSLLNDYAATILIYQAYKKHQIAKTKS